MARLTVISGGRSEAERFEALLRPHYDALFTTAFRLTRSVPDAEDLVQEVCVRAYPRLEELERLDQPRAWLICVMRRLFIDQMRRYERSHVRSLEMADHETLISGEPGPAEHAEHACEAERFDRAWRHLDKDQAALLTLHDIEGYTLAELNGMTGIKEGTLKSRLHRARVRLGRLMQRESTATALQAGRGATR